MENKVKIGLIQTAMSASKDTNLQNSIKQIREAADRGAQIICLPEMFNTQYFCHEENSANFKLADEPKSALFDQLKDLAREIEAVLIIPFFEKRAKGLYHNSAMVIDADGTNLGLYRKNHIPDDPGYYEKYYFTPGDLGYRVFKTRYANIGVLICWDQWYPEAARLIALQGADILFYPTAIGWEESEAENDRQDMLHAWQTIQKSHAVANGVFMASINRTGSETLTRFWGNSFVANPVGKVLQTAPEKEPAILVQEIDLDEIEQYRTYWPFLRDRRIDTFSDITNRFLEEK